VAAFRQGRVAAVIESNDRIIRALVETEIGELSAIGFPRMLGPVNDGDEVVLNTTGIELGLGTGGVAFILWNVSSTEMPEQGDGHIVKMRYTPWQTTVLASEAPEGPHHDMLQDAKSIQGMPVVACPLHSQVAAAAAGIRAAAPDVKIGYLMTDGAALPMAWSELAQELCSKGLIDVTCTVGHAFGGDIEAVNVFSGLAALRLGEKVDVAIAAMGPGVVGTHTALGFSALEQGQILDAVTALKGRPVAALRIAFHDQRERHRGVSHHSLTALTIAARERATVVVPELTGLERESMVHSQLEEAGVSLKHDLVMASGRPGLEFLNDADIEPASMGHRMRDAPELFLAAAAAGTIAVDPSKGRVLR
jgi:hypothetical protein